MIKKLIHKIMCHFGYHEFGFTFWRTDLSGRTTWFKQCYWCNAETVNDECKNLNKLYKDIESINPDFSTMTTTSMDVVKKNTKYLN